MRTTKAKWKRAPKDQRRVTSDRTLPNARFARRQRSRSLPPPLPHASGGRSLLPLVLFGGLAALVIAVIVIAVIAVSTVVQAKQQYDTLNWQAGYYGLPTQPFSNVLPGSTQPAPDSTLVAFNLTPLPEIANAGLTVASSVSALTEPDGRATTDKTLASFCDKFGTPTAINIFDWNDWSEVDLTNPLVAQLPLSWDASADLWRGYNSAKPFDQPDDARDRWRLRLFTADGTEHWIQIAQSPSTPDTLYAYAFQVITPYTDARGQHFGYHPCRAFSIPYGDISILLSSARAYQSSGSRFPAFAAPDDSRWVRATITPLSGSFDLRAIPTIQNNQPVKTVSTATTGYFIVDADWGVWAQVKLGNTIAWLDTSTVRMEASS